ncbi:MAG: 2-hydroxyacid dehydrogenase [Bacteroidales bacterium]|jgi:D-lactate dehydrogenase|nr:2-hydroxyacid dehydrogenase [Bacteroidales bacterium]MDD3161437.1 2-hydroxyacid dehydrogenase [Bacteroidales bacterium]
MKPTSIAFFGTQPYDEESFEKTNEEFGFDIRYFKGHLNKHNVMLSQETDAVCIFVNDFADACIMKALAKNGVKLLALRCAGYNNVDLKAAKENGIRIVRVPAYSPYAVAEHTVALMLTLNRKVNRASWRTRDGNFSLNGLIGFDMHGKSAGIIGTGRIAKVLIQILKGFGMNVLAYDLHQDEAFAKEHNITYVTLDQLYKESDIISLHCPLTEETKYMINKQSIDKMKKGVMIINTGRGALINTNDLIEGLKDKKIGYAGLDVYEEESNYFYEDQSNSVMDDDVLARLLSFNNVIVTSHQAFFTKEALTNISHTTLQNIQDFQDGKELVNEVV